MKPWRERAAEGIEPEEIFHFSRTFTREDVEEFGDITRDYNPVHYDEPFTRIKGFDCEICHGLLVGSMLCEIGGQMGWLASGMSFSFLRPVYIGDTVTCTMTILSVTAKQFARAEVSFVNQTGAKVMRAQLEGFLPGARARERLSEMVKNCDPTNKARGRG